MSKSTTFKCPTIDNDRIRKISDIEGMTISELVLLALDKFLPLDDIPRFKKDRIESSVKVGVVIPESIQIRINEAKEYLSSDIRTVKQWEIILQCVLLKCPPYEELSV